MALPLYGNFQLQGAEAEAHPGLRFDKFADGWSKGWHQKLDSGVKKSFFTQFEGRQYSYLQAGLDAYLERQEQLVCHLCRSGSLPLLPLKTDWRFISGLGSGHPYETGFIWHRTLGVPYLPGSSIKGLMRAWLEQWCEQDETTEEEVRYLFGTGAEEGVEDSAGALIVFDALPVRVPKLELDILNPHYGPYYDDPDNNPPADYYSPVPVFFLTVAPDQPFRFCLAPGKGESTETAEDIKKGIRLLRDALETLGAGGKTAVGYGTMTSKRTREDVLRQEAENWLEEALNELRNHRDMQGQPEENLWKKALAERWRFAPAAIKPELRQMIRIAWSKKGINWNTPEGKSARKAKAILSGI